MADDETDRDAYHSMASAAIDFKDVYVMSGIVHGELFSFLVFESSRILVSWDWHDDVFVMLPKMQSSPCP